MFGIKTNSKLKDSVVLFHADSKLQMNCGSSSSSFAFTERKKAESWVGWEWHGLVISIVVIVVVDVDGFQFLLTANKRERSLINVDDVNKGCR